MADESSGQEKTEEPTLRRLQEAREKGYMHEHRFQKWQQETSQS